MAGFFFFFMKHFFSLLSGWSGPLLILLWLVGPAARAQVPAWQVAMATTGTSSLSEATAVGTDAAGNVYISGSFQGTVGFGATTLSSAGSYDLFVAKWNPALAAFDWAVRAGGLANDGVNALAVGSNGIYLAGYTQSTLLNFGSSTVGPNNGTDAFVAKITPSGQFMWSLGISGDGFEEALALAVNGAVVYVGGHSTGNAVNFGPWRTANAAAVNAGTDDGFVARIDEAGTSAGFAWARGVGGPLNDVVRALTVTGRDLLVAGSFRGTCTFGTATLSSAGFQDVFVGKLFDVNGVSSQWAWAQRAGGAGGDDVATGVAVRGSRAYVCGHFDGATAGFGATTLASAGNYDAFVAELTDLGNSGSFDWALRAGGTNDDRATGLVYSYAGVCVAGYSYSPTATFGATTVTNFGSADVFVARVIDEGATGRYAWAQRAGGAGIDQAFGVARSGADLYVAGTVSPQAIFTPLVINTPVSTRIPFFAGLREATLTATASARGTLSFSLTPNPARTAATVQLPAAAGPSTFVLIDALGRTLRTHAATSGARVELDLRGLAPGLYAVQVQAGGTTGTQRLLVE
jgi:hypothetical protein